MMFKTIRTEKNTSSNASYPSFTFPVYANWKIQIDDDRIIWLSFDKENSSTNIIDMTVLSELKEILQIIKKEASIAGLVIQSAKKNGFIAGADIHQFSQVKNVEEALIILDTGQSVFAILESLTIPTLAYINGFCLGGGLELALACRYRIAVDQPKTKLGLPEILLGIHPGWGGTVRLPQLVGIIKAMDLILSGRTVNAKTAMNMGLVDAIVPLRVAHFAIQSFLKKQPKLKKATLFTKMMNIKWIRSLLGQYLQKRLARKINRANYPAPFAVIEHWVAYGEDPSTAYTNEAKSVAQLMISETARHLVRVFFLKEMLKNFAKEKEIKSETGVLEPIQHIHIVGGGIMGGDIASWCALKGYRVTVEDTNANAIAATLQRALALFKKQLKDHVLIQAAQDRLLPDIKGYGVKNADLIIEAIVEQKEAKRALFKKLEQTAKASAIFATNTSSIPLEELSGELQNPGRLVGLHYFNPVSRMPLVEVISNHKTDPIHLEKVIKFAGKCDKLPLPVQSAPGFLVNRILMPYLLESVLMVEEGIPLAAIDKAAKEFGLPMGPLELLDVVGLDVALHASESLKVYLPEINVPSLIHQHVTAGKLGKKTSSGFYQYKEGKIIIEKIDPHYRLPEDTLDRLVLRMLNEAVACLREGIVNNADLIDAGMIFGAGFPPFRGGPMYYAAEQGESLLIQRLNLLAQRYGKRFIPDTGWQESYF